MKIPKFFHLGGFMHMYVFEPDVWKNKSAPPAP